MPITRDVRRIMLVATSTLALAGLAAPAPEAARGLGIPADASPLFSVSAEGGTLTKVKGKGRYVLTLKPVARHATWFSDRPARRTGALTIAALTTGWRRLGFTDDPPNAVLTLLGGRASADTIALELGTPRYNARTRTLRIRAQALSGLPQGLARYRPRLDRTVPPRFSDAALFIDDGGYNAAITQGGCTIGQAVLLAISSGWSSQWAGYLRAADGTSIGFGSDNDPNLLAIVINEALGSPGSATSVQVPNIAAPAGLRWWMCSVGAFPQTNADGPPYQSLSCNTGEIHAFAGRSATSPGAIYPGPDWRPRSDLPAPAPGLVWWQCDTGLTGTQVEACTVGEMTLFAGAQLPSGYTPADGRSIAINSNQALFAALQTGVYTAENSTFTLPALTGIGAGTTYGICSSGTFPV